MEFWGVEVKAGQSLKVEPELGKLVHISQASLGEVKDVKGAKCVPLRMKINAQNFVIGSLSAEERPQLLFDLVFEKEFELSHDWKNGSVFFVGYIANDPDDDGGDYSDMSEYEDELVHNHENGKCDHKTAAAQPKKGAKAVAKEEETSDSDDDDEIDSDDSDEEMGLADEDDLSGDDSDEGDEDDSDSSEEEEIPQAKPSKKRAAEPAKQAAVPAKKAKSATPDNKGNKKSHTATPFPAKSSGKVPAGKKSNEKSPKSGPFSSNKKAKHGGK